MANFKAKRFYSELAESTKRTDIVLGSTEPASILSRIRKLYSSIRRIYSKKKLRAGKIDRSLLQGESYELFSAAIRSPATRDPYERKLLGFLKRVNLSSYGFAQFAKENPSLAEKKIISLLSQDRFKIEREEITAGTVNNWLKAVRLFLEMNDVVLRWKFSAKLRTFGGSAEGLTGSVNLTRWL